MSGSAHSGNILLVANYAASVGYAWWLMENFWLQIARVFAPAGRRCILAYPSIDAIPEPIAASALEVVEFDVHNADAGSLRRFLATQEVSSVYLTDWPYWSPSYARLRRAGVRRIVTHDHTPGDRPPIAGLRGALKSALNRLPWITCDAYLTVSSVLVRRAEQNLRIPRDRIFLVENGIEPLDKSAAPADLEASFGIPRGSRVVVSTGRANCYKGIDFILDCAQAALRDRGLEGLYFVYCGDGPDYAAARSRVAALGLAERVILAGRRDDVSAIIRAADIGFHASLGEGLSLSILELMSAELAVLVPDLPSVSQTIEHGRTGLVYPSRQLPGALDAIERCAADPALRAALGKAASERVDAHYNLARCNCDFVAAIADLL